MSTYKMFGKRILIVAVALAVVATAAAFLAQASTSQATDVRTTTAGLNPALYGQAHFPNPCETDMGLNYVDGKFHGKSGPGQIGVNYFDGKVHKNDIPLFTPDDQPLCSH